MIPKRHKRAKRGRDGDIPAHRAFIRKHYCAIPDCLTPFPTECAHVRDGVPPLEAGGTGMKPHDKWTVPLCRLHHAHQHRVGESAFWALHKTDPHKTAAALWRISPARIREEKRNG